jgi:hypothetical protein
VTDLVEIRGLESRDEDTDVDFDDLLALVIESSPDGTLIQTGNSTAIWLNGVAVAELNADNFIFV